VHYVGKNRVFHYALYKSIQNSITNPGPKISILWARLLMFLVFSLKECYDVLNQYYMISIYTVVTNDSVLNKLDQCHQTFVSPPF
jgi:hypothetical protein